VVEPIELAAFRWAGERAGESVAWRLELWGEAEVAAWRVELDDPWAGERPA